MIYILGLLSMYFCHKLLTFIQIGYGHSVLVLILCPSYFITTVNALFETGFEISRLQKMNTQHFLRPKHLWFSEVETIKYMLWF